jgi:TonB family protein
MNPIAESLVRTSAVLLGGLVLQAMLSRRSAAVRHGVLVVTLISGALVLPASLIVPSWTVVVPASPHPAVAPVSSAVIVPASVGSLDSPARLDTLPPRLPSPALVWACGFAVGVAFLVAGLTRLSRIARRGRPVADARWIDSARSVAATYGLNRNVVLLETDAPFLVATWGLRPARVLLPPGATEWSDDRIRAVMCHELAHVARADWAVQLTAQLMLAALWFNPLAWLVCRRLRRESEQACDDAVLDRGIGAAEYAAHLVTLARASRRPSWSSWMPALPMARPSAFERRIAVMLNPRVDRRPLSLRTASACVVVLAALTLATAALRAVQAPAALTGVVYDATGAVMPGVEVTLEDAQQRTSKATTDASGRFAFPGIGSGQYVLSASLAGFKSLRDKIELAAASDWDRVVTLQIGVVQETITVSERRMPPAPSAARPARVRVGGNIRVPSKTLDVRPVYPASMREAGREGQVSIEAVIAADGSVSSVRVTNAQVHPDFAIAAVDAVRQWRFTPTLLNGQPVEVVMTVTVRFSLSD